MLNLDFGKKVVINTHAQDWIQSPLAGVWRKPLAREEAERGHATSIVRYDPAKMLEASKQMPPLPLFVNLRWEVFPGFQPGRLPLLILAKEKYLPQPHPLPWPCNFLIGKNGMDSQAKSLQQALILWKSQESSCHPQRLLPYSME